MEVKDILEVMKVKKLVASIKIKEVSCWILVGHYSCRGSTPVNFDMAILPTSIFWTRKTSLSIIQE